MPVYFCLVKNSACGSEYPKFVRDGNGAVERPPTELGLHPAFLAFLLRLLIPETLHSVALVPRLEFWDCLHPLEDRLLLWLPPAFFELFRRAFFHGFQRTLRGVHPFACVQRKGGFFHPGSFRFAPCRVAGFAIGTGASGEGVFVRYRGNAVV